MLTNGSLKTGRSSLQVDKNDMDFESMILSVYAFTGDQQGDTARF
jgi:hypothetical protein